VLLAGLFCWVFSDVIFQDRNFVYRDASQFYYPLLQLVKDEWQAGRWPLWNPQENAGMPLLGNPASAVLYPPRIVIFQWLPVSYATAFKMYTLVHVALCALAAWTLARHWRFSEFAAVLVAMTYAFGAAVMFQYCNVIFLVGAAWVPLALLTADRALGTGDWRWACAHGLVLALQLVGGDPEAAYVSGGLSAIYLAMIDVPFALALLDGIGATVIVRWYTAERTSVVKTWAEQALPVVAIAMVGATPLLQWLHRRHYGAPDRRLAWRRRACLLLAGVVAAGTSAVQWIPSWEFGRISNRAAGGVHYEPYAFWIAPWRLAELFWPNVMGREFPIQTRWIDILAVADKMWEPSLYFGVVPALLALSAWSVRKAPHWQRWLSVILLFSLWASMGPAGGLRWYATGLPHSMHAAFHRSEVPEDSATGGSRQDMQTPAGGLYWLMMEGLPGFDTFRYPAKLMTFATMAFAALAGVGWDRWMRGEGGRRWVLPAATAASAALAVGALLVRGPMIRWLDDSWLAEGTPYYGPLVAAQAWMHMFRGFVTTTLLLTVIFVLRRYWAGHRFSPFVSAAVLLLVAVDVAAANRWMIVTAPQSKIDAVPKIAQILRDAEAENPHAEPGVPMRIHRISIWAPRRWFRQSAPDRAEDTYLWEKDTIQPKHGLPFGITYTINEGTLEPYDYWWFFAPFYANATPEPRSVVYYPLRGYDMWGARYFVLPLGYDRKDQHRGFLTFLQRSTLIAQSEIDEDDFQVRRNESAYPRAWIVHQLLCRPPISGLAKADRMNRMGEILYEGFDGYWTEKLLENQVQDPHRVAWIEESDAVRVMSFHDPVANREADRCRITRYEPDRVELEVEMGGRGVLVLADLLYPGWEVTVDKEPGTIWRANRMMRGVPLMPGKHIVEFTFRPLTVRVGATISLASLAVLALAFVQPLWRRVAHGASGGAAA
jgi:hypothetical protein